MSEDDNGNEKNLPDRPEQQTPAERPEQTPAEPSEQPQVSITAGFQLTQTWSSVGLPPPQLLREFNEAVPGAADVIVSEFQEQGRHRRGVELLRAKAEVFAVKAGATWPPAIDALVILTGFGVIGLGSPFIGAGLLLFEVIVILLSRWLRTVQGESEATQGSEDSGKDDEEATK